MSRKINKNKIITDLKSIGNKAFRIGASKGTIEMIENAATRLEFELKENAETTDDAKTPTE